MQEPGTMNQQRTMGTALEHVIRLGLSVVSRLCKTATKPTKFSGPNTTTLLLYKLILIYKL